MSEDLKVVVVGSIGIDTIETPNEKKVSILGGSVSYACAASAFHASTGMVGVVGTDFPEDYVELYKKFNIDTNGLQTEEGETFRWSGVYDDDMINRTTLSTELNVFESFDPVLPDSYKNVPFLLLGNITPGLQLSVLSQVENVEFVVADTMDLWINISRDALLEVVSKVDMLTLNDSEARLLTGMYNLKDCAKAIMDMGPRYVVIKKGEHGAMLIDREGIFLVPAYPVDAVMDPTGAGDSFAGGFLGKLTTCPDTGDSSMRESLLYGSVIASFGVEQFSLDGLQELNMESIEARMAELKSMMTV